MAERVTKAPNYSEELTAAIVQRYKAGESVQSIAESIGKTVRSVIAKLVREGAYIAPEKPVKADKDEGPSKKEMLRELASLDSAFPVDQIANATKEAIQAVIDRLRARSEMSSQMDRAA